MIPRQLQAELLTQLGEFPIVTVLGPRQAGKTTLVRAACPDFGHVSLEDPETRAIAQEDPKGFLQQYDQRVIFDEIQRTPELLSYLQGRVDAQARNGQFILTGSHQLSLRAAVSQSLAGRTGLLHLLPLSIGEMRAADLSFEHFSNYLFYGFLPRIYDHPDGHFKIPHPVTRDLKALTDAGLIEKGQDGRCHVGFDRMRFDFSIDAAA